MMKEKFDTAVWAHAFAKNLYDDIMMVKHTCSTEKELAERYTSGNILVLRFLKGACRRWFDFRSFKSFVEKAMRVQKIVSEEDMKTIIDILDKYESKGV